MAQRNSKKKSQTPKNDVPKDGVKKADPANEINAILQRYLNTELTLEASEGLHFLLNRFWLFVKEFPPGAVDIKSVTANKTHYLMKFECKLPHKPAPSA